MWEVMLKLLGTRYVGFLEVFLIVKKGRRTCPLPSRGRGSILKTLLIAQKRCRCGVCISLLSPWLYKEFFRSVDGVAGCSVFVSSWVFLDNYTLLTSLLVVSGVCGNFWTVLQSTEKHEIPHQHIFHPQDPSSNLCCCLKKNLACTNPVWIIALAVSEDFPRGI